MKRLLVLVTPLLIFVLIWGAIGCGEEATPTPTATTGPTATPAATTEVTPAPTSTVIATATPGSSPAATSAPTPTPTGSPTPTPTGTAMGTPTPTPTPAGAAKPEGELNLALASVTAGSLDPLKVGNLAMVTFFTLLYDYLVGSDDDGNLSTETGVAQKWEHSADYLSWTFNLHEGIKFHNGDDLTADDVKFTLEQLGHPELVTTNARAIHNNIEEIVIDGPYQVTVNLKSPDFFLEWRLSPLSTKEGFVRPKKYIEANGLDNFAVNPVGSGPYRLVEHKQDSYVKLEALDHHWSLGAPRYKYITLYDAPEDITRIAMLKGGQVDGIEFSRQSLPVIQKEGYNIFTSRLGMTVYVTFDVHVGASNPASDGKVREALWLAIDAQSILDNLLGGKGELIGSRNIYPYVLGSEDLPPKPYDPERAKQLLKEAGYPERFANPTLNIYSWVRAGFPEGPAMMEAIASYWMKVGVRVKITPVDQVTYAATHRARNVANLVPYVAYAPQKLSAASLAATLSSVGRSAFFTDPPDPGMDALLDEQTAAKTADEFLAVATKIFRYEYETSRALGLFTVPRFFATTQKIKQWDLGMLGFDFLNLRNLVKR